MKIRPAWVLLAVGAVGLAWLWLRSRSGSGPATSVATPIFEDQVGSNIREDSTPELVGQAFEFARETIDKANCYRLVDSGIFSDDGMASWVPAGEPRDSPNAIRLPAGQPPRNACGY